MKNKSMLQLAVELPPYEDGIVLAWKAFMLRKAGAYSQADFEFICQSDDWDQQRKKELENDPN